MPLGGSGANPSYIATNTVHVSRAVTQSAVAGATSPASPGFLGCVECGTTQQPIGISQEGCFDTPGLTGSDETIAARAGYGVHVYGLGETCWGLCSSTGLAIAAGNRVIVVSSDGKLGPLVGAGNSGTWVVGFALDDIPPGKVGRIFIDPQQIAIPQS